MNLPSFKIDPVTTVPSDSIKVCPLGPPRGIIHYIDVSYEIEVEWMEVMRIVEWIEVKSK